MAGFGYSIGSPGGKIFPAFSSPSAATAPLAETNNASPQSFAQECLIILSPKRLTEYLYWFDCLKRKTIHSLGLPSRRITAFETSLKSLEAAQRRRMIYGLGKVLYEICTGLGRRDFPGLPGDIV